MNIRNWRFALSAPVILIAVAVQFCSAEDASPQDHSTVVINKFKRLVTAVQTARNRLEAVRARGEFSIQKHVVSGSGRFEGLPESSTAHYSFEYLERDCGLYRRLISTPAPGTSDEFNYQTRMASSSNHVLDAGDLSKGYVRPATSQPIDGGDLLSAFWHSNDDPGEIVPTAETAEAWEVTSILADRDRLSSQYDRLKCVYEMDSAGFPLLYEVFVNEISMSKHEWKWGQISGLDYPVSLTTTNRTTYPSGDIETTITEMKFTEVEIPSKVDEAEFGFPALGLKPGTTVYDMRDPAQPRYEFQPNSGAVDGLVKLAPPVGPKPNGAKRRQWGSWIVVLNVVVTLFLIGLFVRKRMFN